MISSRLNDAMHGAWLGAYLRKANFISRLCYGDIHLGWTCAVLFREKRERMRKIETKPEWSSLSYPKMIRNSVMHDCLAIVKRL